jgi:hypothetical protein
VAELEAIPPGPDSKADVRALSDAYISFALRNRELWNLLQQHTPKPGKISVQLVDENFKLIIALLAGAIKPLVKEAREAEIQQIAHSVWASIHGISAIAVAGKISTMPIETARPCVATVIDCFLCKLSQAS